MSNKTSDKNVANIEEDIKYVKEMLEIARVFFKAVKTETDYKDVDDVAFCNAVEHILAELEQKNKRIKELEEENRIFALEGSKVGLDLYIKENYIPMQVVIDKMEELNKEIKSGDEIDAIFKIKQQQVLQELLEGEKNRNEYRKTN